MPLGFNCGSSKRHNEKKRLRGPQGSPQRVQGGGETEREKPEKRICRGETESNQRPFVPERGRATRLRYTRICGSIYRTT